MGILISKPLRMSSLHVNIVALIYLYVGYIFIYLPRKKKFWYSYQMENLTFYGWVFMLELVLVVHFRLYLYYEFDLYIFIYEIF